MKKFFIACMVLITVVHSHCYTLRIKNETNKQIEVEVIYKRLCSKDNVTVMPKKTETINHKLCCITNIRVKSVSGPQRGSWVDFQPALTGFGKSCRSNKIKVSERADQSLRVAMDEPKTRRGHWFIMKNKTDMAYEVTIEYGSPLGLCEKKVMILSPNITETYKTGRRLLACCISKVWFKPKSGSWKNTPFEYQPKRTQLFGKSCRDNAVRITANPDGSPFIEDVAY